MILSGLKIRDEIRKGNIQIEPYNEKQLNPNSYNLRLHNELLVYTEPVLDVKKPNGYKIISIPEDGLVLEPGVLYLGRTLEYTATQGFVPMLEGRSSIGRLGLCVHVTAGFGDVGFSGYWTLEIHAVQPVKVYPGIEVCYDKELVRTDAGYITESLSAVRDRGLEGAALCWNVTEAPEENLEAVYRL